MGTKGVLDDEGSEYYSIVSYFMEFHRDELGEDVVKEMFSTDAPSALSLTEMVDFLRLSRFGSVLDEEMKRQMFIYFIRLDCHTAAVEQVFRLIKALRRDS